MLAVNKLCYAAVWLSVHVIYVNAVVQVQHFAVGNYWQHVGGLC